MLSYWRQNLLADTSQILSTHNLIPWHHQKFLRQYNLPVSVINLFCNAHSMTRQLEALGQASLRVMVCQHKWELPERNEAMLLNIPNRQYALVREVFLLMNDNPWMFARTVFPKATLQGELYRLRFLGDKPLGKVLFQNPLLKRSSFQFATLTQEHSLFSKSCKLDNTVPNKLWTRQSQLFIKEKRLLLKEVFLPKLIATISK